MRTFDVYDADTSSGVLRPVGYVLATVHVADDLETEDFVRALVDAKLMPAKAKVIDGDGDGEIFGMTVRLPNKRVRDFFLQLVEQKTSARK